jgi:hypothetical protein
MPGPGGNPILGEAASDQFTTATGRVACVCVRYDSLRMKDVNELRIQRFRATIQAQMDTDQHHFVLVVIVKGNSHRLNQWA